jgi:prephenate dehydrogenase
MAAPVRSLAVVGTGLIGASAGLAARRAGVEDVRGWDPDEDALRVAAERGAVEIADGLTAAVASAELVLVAAPVASLPAQVRDTLDLAGDDATVTDVGSTKGPVCAAAAGDPRFVGGHPICGAETRGPDRANAELFESATWFLTPSSTTPPDRFRTVHGFVSALGARPIAIDPVSHDRLVAVTSHLPHALANVLLNHAGASRVDGHDPLAAAGGSLRDMTRIAGANPRIWVDIFLDNREALAAALGEHRRRVEQLEAALAAGDAGFLARWIAEAGGNRRRMLATAYEDPGTLQRLRVHIPDRPGVLAGIFQALGAERINVEDFEMEHMSPERGGTLTVLVAGDAEAERATALLEAQGYGVVSAPVLEGAPADQLESQ